MDYTDEQYELMERLSKHVLWEQLSDREQELVSYLDRQRIANPRADIEDGLWTLSPDGERVLAAHRKKVLASKIQTRRELEALQNQESIRQENIRAEQAQEQKELERVVREKADRQADRAAEHRFQIILNFGLSLFSAVIGAILSNLDRLIPWIISLFD